MRRRKKATRKPSPRASHPREDERFRLVVEAAPNAIVLIGEDGKIVLVNSQAEKLFGYAREELLGRPIEILVPERYRRAHVSHRAGFFAAPNARAMGSGRDLFGIRKDGSEVPIEIGLNPVKNPLGTFVLASIIDITERRALQRQLAQGEVLAAIGGMVTVVAHEIRNPLNSLVMAAKNMAKGGLSPEEQEQVLSVLVGESQRLDRTLSDFLQFARPREPRKAQGDLNATTREVVSAAKSDRGIVGRTEVKVMLDKGVPPLPFDADQIRQVLWNIIRNAFQALNGRGRLEVRTEAGPREVAIHVQDSGPGIHPDQIEKMFTPFYTTKTKGTGLGLSTSRNIVHAHGGDIRVSSAPGKGARFTILLPRPPVR